MMNTRSVFAVMAVVALLASCSSSDNEKRVVARAYNNYLYQSDIEGLVGEGVSAEDSVAIVRNYINQWLQQQVVLEKAKKNVKKDFEKELQNYKNSLLAYEYEQLVVEQLLDTNVSEKDIADYYESNRESFSLRTPILKAGYLKLPKESNHLNQIERLFAKAHLTDDDLLQIQRIASASAVDFSFDIETWQPLYKFLSAVPFETSDGENAFRGRKVTKTSDEEFVYVVRIEDFHSAGDLAPQEYVTEDIKTILLNRRKIDIIKNMQRDLLKKADANGKIEIM